jgi:CRP/FNR family transcriptional regulator, anaerobic regulatory protein
MHEVLRTYLERNFPVTEKDFALIKELLQKRSIKKGEFLLREGQVAKEGIFVVSGCLRSYIVDNKGKEHILQFAPKDWWISDFHSLMNSVPTTYFIDAIEDSEVLPVSPEAHRRMMQEIPSYAASFQAGLQRHTSAKERRIIASLSATAEERYNDFLKTYPSIAKRVPQHMLASYIGITPETLSRVRKQLSRKIKTFTS